MCLRHCRVMTGYYVILPCKQYNWTSGTYSIEILYLLSWLLVMTVTPSTAASLNWCIQEKKTVWVHCKKTDSWPQILQGVCKFMEASQLSGQWSVDGQADGSRNNGKFPFSWRQCGREVRALDLQFGDPDFKSRPYRRLSNLFSVVRGSNPWPH